MAKTILTNMLEGFGAVMVQRAQILHQLTVRQFDLSVTSQYDFPCLIDCCARLSKDLPNVTVSRRVFQKELIENPAFSSFYAALLSAFAKYESQHPQSKEETDRAVPAAKPIQEMMTERLCELVESCQTYDCEITQYPIPDIMQTLSLDDLYSYNRLCYLINYAPMHLTDEQKSLVAKNLSHCGTLPIVLDDAQKALLEEAFVGTRELFSENDFCEIWALLQDKPEVKELIRFFHQNEIDEVLDLTHYKCISQDVALHMQLLTSIFEKVGRDATGAFVRIWALNDCPLHELKVMERRATEMPDTDWDAAFASRVSYVNLLYGKRLKEIDLKNLPSFQENLLIYAITHKKKHFIHLVDENAETFLDVPHYSLLYADNMYAAHMNLNELSQKDLKDLVWMRGIRLDPDLLMPHRQYTFVELRALYGLSPVYLRLYHHLTSDKQDYRLLVLRQLVKRDALSESLSGDDISTLAEYLNTKPLSQWQEQEFGHIAGLQVSDVVAMLIHFEQLWHLLPCIHDQTEALLAVQNAEYLYQFDTIDALLDNIHLLDPDWAFLSSYMELSETFLQEHHRTICQFLGRNGAHIARAYLHELPENSCKAFCRIVKAELMGKLHELKYFAGDLQKELGAAIPERTQAQWTVNTSLDYDGIQTQEYDDFYSTILLGTQPERTCISYIDGPYKHCLLSSFDTNKKVLYAHLGGCIAGRAYLRLTKGRKHHAHVEEADAPAFTFVDVETMGSTSAVLDKDEQLVLFLERPYISGVDPKTQKQIESAFVKLADQKATSMNALAVLSYNYRDIHPDGFALTSFDLYISASKASAQYLDSLGGCSTVANTNRYYENSFLVKQDEKFAVME